MENIFLKFCTFASLILQNYEVMELNEFQIWNQRPHISLEHYDTYIYTRPFFTLLTSVFSPLLTYSKSSYGRLLQSWLVQTNKKEYNLNNRITFRNCSSRIAIIKLLESLPFLEMLGKCLIQVIIL